jgi:preprotein translocase subunit SecG
MHKLQKMTIFVTVSFFLICLSTSCCPLIAFAADGSSEDGVSKGLTAFIMIAVFLVTAVAAGFISYKLKVKNIRKKKEETSDNE